MRALSTRILVLFLCLTNDDTVAMAQQMPVNDNNPLNKMLQVNLQQNNFINADLLDSSFEKLVRLKLTSTGQFTIVHIGDSHLQAGFLTSHIRRSMQSFFGNAGRGLVFPYQLARSNAPKDIISNSQNTWTFNRLAHPEINTLSGIAGFIISSDTISANLHFELIDDSTGEQKTFNKIRMFAKMKDSTEWTIKSQNQSFILNNQLFNHHQCATIELQQPSVSFDLFTDTTTKKKVIYGFSLENHNPGLLYHTLAVNGAQYSQYDITPTLWKQLPELNADMYIISLGTNEAQKPEFDSVCFKESIDSMLIHIKSISPNANLIICTVADNYKKGIPGNKEIKAVNEYLLRYCKTNHIACWDLYHITNGQGSAKKWHENGMMSKDRIHFNATGYEYQGYLLYQALSRAYNTYLEKSKL